MNTPKQFQMSDVKLKDLDEKQVYEWVRVGLWDCKMFMAWLSATKAGVLDDSGVL